MCVYVEAKGEYWGVFLYHSPYYFDTRSPLLLKAPLVSAPSPAPGLQIFTWVLGIEAQPFLLAHLPAELYHLPVPDKSLTVVCG